jgi:hypothetical protein
MIHMHRIRSRLMRENHVRSLQVLNKFDDLRADTGEMLIHVFQIVMLDNMTHGIREVRIKRDEIKSIAQITLVTVPQEELTRKVFGSESSFILNWAGGYFIKNRLLELLPKDLEKFMERISAVRPQQ